MSQKPRLILAVDQIAVLRSTRTNREPDPVHFALQAELAGCAGIRAHLRLDRRYLTEEDAELLNRMVKKEFYLQVSPHQDIVHLVNGLRPSHLVLGGERRDGFSSDLGLDVTLLYKELQGLLHNVDQRHTRVFLLIDPELDYVKAAAKLDVQGVVIHVRDLMGDPHSSLFQSKFHRIRDAIKLARKYGLTAQVTGEIDHLQIAYLKQIPDLSAIHIGHPIIARALQVGVYEAVQFFARNLQS